MSSGQAQNVASRPTRDNVVSLTERREQVSASRAQTVEPRQVPVRDAAMLGDSKSGNLEVNNRETVAMVFNKAKRETPLVLEPHTFTVGVDMYRGTTLSNLRSNLRPNGNKIILQASQSSQHMPWTFNSADARDFAEGKYSSQSKEEQIPVVMLIDYQKLKNIYETQGVKDVLPPASIEEDNNWYNVPNNLGISLEALRAIRIKDPSGIWREIDDKAMVDDIVLKRKEISQIDLTKFEKVYEMANYRDQAMLGEKDPTKFQEVIQSEAYRVTQSKDGRYGPIHTIEPRKDGSMADAHMQRVPLYALKDEGNQVESSSFDAMSALGYNYKGRDQFENPSSAEINGRVSEILGDVPFKAKDVEGILTDEQYVKIHIFEQSYPKGKNGFIFFHDGSNHPFGEAVFPDDLAKVLVAKFTYKSKLDEYGIEKADWYDMATYFDYLTMDLSDYLADRDRERLVEKITTYLVKQQTLISPLPDSADKLSAGQKAELGKLMQNIQSAEKAIANEPVEATVKRFVQEVDQKITKLAQAGLAERQVRSSSSAQTIPVGRDQAMLSQDDKNDFVQKAVAGIKPVQSIVSAVEPPVAKAIVEVKEKEKFEGRINIANDEHVVLDIDENAKNSSVALPGVNAQKVNRDVRILTHELVINALAARPNASESVQVQLKPSANGDLVLSVQNNSQKVLKSQDLYQRAIELSNASDVKPVRFADGRTGFIGARQVLQAGDVDISSQDVVDSIKAITEDTNLSENAKIKTILSIPGFSFGKTPTRFEGTGMGLSFVDAKVKEMGGQWSLTQEPVNEAGTLYKTNVSVVFPSSIVKSASDVAPKVAERIGQELNQPENVGLKTFLQGTHALAPVYAEMIFDTALQDPSDLRRTVSVVKENLKDSGIELS
ncbi:MAG: hypothetical protein JNN05_01145, partial [Candidatus Omnitrophica bacterium]|nr:hypothetical protein [Candidatus Omnitrophota bacterium]